LGASAQVFHSGGYLGFMSTYIYTQPKAGTYFIAELLSNLGFHNTGIHLSMNNFLDTKRLSLEQNIATPGLASVDKFFVPVVREIGRRDVIFGHFPLPLNRHVAPPHMKYICSYRSPERALVSEFIDFRFRRSDVLWVSHDAVADDVEAFELYLERHGLGPHLSIFKNIVVYHGTVTHPLEEPKERARVCFVHFDTLLTQPNKVRQLAAFLGVEISEQTAKVIHHKTLTVETKTKATMLDIERETLWSDRARALFRNSDFPLAIARAKEQGLQV
jgi:hypothetical protein